MQTPISIRLRDGGPIYLQLKEEVIRLACMGMLAPDEQLPSVRTLARELGINPNTVAKAYQELENEGFLYSVSGRGSFISGSILAAEGLRQKAKEGFRAAAEKARQAGVPKGELAQLLQKTYQAKGGGMDDPVQQPE